MEPPTELAAARFDRHLDLWWRRTSYSDITSEAHEALGRLYTFKGWLADNVYPGWHDEPSVREKALAELRAAVAADPNRASAREALRTAEQYAAAARSCLARLGEGELDQVA